MSGWDHTPLLPQLLVAFLLKEGQRIVAVEPTAVSGQRKLKGLIGKGVIEKSQKPVSKKLIILHSASCIDCKHNYLKYLESIFDKGLFSQVLQLLNPMRYFLGQ